MHLLIMLGPNWHILVCSRLFLQHRLATVRVATPMISHHLKQELELFLIIDDEYVKLLHKGYTSFCIVVCDKQLVDNCSTLPVIISICPCIRVCIPETIVQATEKITSVWSHKSSKLRCAVWPAVKVIRLEPGEGE